MQATTRRVRGSAMGTRGKSLTSQEIAEVRSLAEKGVSNTEIARKFGASRPFIANIVAGRRCADDPNRGTYQRASVAEKAKYSADRTSEPAIACPACETQTTVRDLVEHLFKRCPGRRELHHLSEWITWEEALGVVVPLGLQGNLRDWVDKGVVREQGEKYLLRDLVQAIAVKLVAGR